MCPKERTCSASAVSSGHTLKGFRTVATRFDKRAYVFHGTVTVTAIRLWLCS